MTQSTDARDIVERLRDMPATRRVEMRDTAANEIERLRGLLNRWVNLDGDRDDIAKLIAETRTITDA